MIKEKSLVPFVHAKTNNYKIMNMLQAVICGWKIVIGVPPDDRSWDKLNWRRNCRPAKKLLEFFEGDWEKAVTCADDVFNEFKSKNLDCTLDTVCYRAWEWKHRNEMQNEAEMPVGLGAQGRDVEQSTDEKTNKEAQK